MGEDVSRDLTILAATAVSIVVFVIVFAIVTWFLER